MKMADKPELHKCTSNKVNTYAAFEYLRFMGISGDK